MEGVLLAGGPQGSDQGGRLEPRRGDLEAGREPGGSVEAFYFAFGESDAYLIADLPSNVEASALSLAVGASGAASVETVVLLTGSEIDAATKIDVGYRPPAP